MSVSVPLNEGFLASSAGSTSDEMLDGGDGTNALIIAATRDSESEKEILERISDLSENGVELAKSGDGSFYFTGALFDDEARVQMKGIIGDAIDESDVLKNIREILDDIKENILAGAVVGGVAEGGTRAGRRGGSDNGVASAGSSGTQDAYTRYLEDFREMVDDGTNVFSAPLTRDEFERNEGIRDHIDMLRGQLRNGGDRLSERQRRRINDEISLYEGSMAQEGLLDEFIDDDGSTFTRLSDIRDGLSDIGGNIGSVRQAGNRGGLGSALESARGLASDAGTTSALKGLASKAGYVGLALAGLDAVGSALNKAQDYKNIGIAGGYTGTEALAQGLMEEGSSNFRAFFSTLDAKQIRQADEAAAKLGYNENTAGGLQVSGFMQDMMKDYGVSVSESSTFYKTLVKAGTMSSKDLEKSIDNVADIAKEGFISTKDAISDWVSSTQSLEGVGVSTDVSEALSEGYTTAEAASEALSTLGAPSSANQLRMQSNIAFGNERGNMTDEEWGEYSYYRAIVYSACWALGVTENALRSTAAKSGRSGIASLFGALSSDSVWYENPKLNSFRNMLSTFSLSFDSSSGVDAAAQLICDALAELYDINIPMSDEEKADMYMPSSGDTLMEAYGKSLALAGMAQAALANEIIVKVEGRSYDSDGNETGTIGSRTNTTNNND